MKPQKSKIFVISSEFHFNLLPPSFPSSVSDVKRKHCANCATFGEILAHNLHKQRPLAPRTLVWRYNIQPYRALIWIGGDICWLAKMIFTKTRTRKTACLRRSIQPFPITYLDLGHFKLLFLTCKMKKSDTTTINVDITDPELYDDVFGDVIRGLRGETYPSALGGVVVLMLYLSPLGLPETALSIPYAVQ